MNMEHLPSMICTALMRIGTRMATGFDRWFADTGMTQALFRTLLAVWEAGGTEGIAPSELADYLMIERATVTMLTTRLVEQGLLERKPGINRRTFQLVLTERGGQALQEFAPRAMALAQETLEGLSEEEMKALWAALQTVEAQMRAFGEKHFFDEQEGKGRN